MENLNAHSKIAIKVDELLNKNWDYVGITKEGTKTLQNEPALYIKTVKTMSKYHVSCLNLIEQTWSIADQNRFL